MHFDGTLTFGQGYKNLMNQLIKVSVLVCALSAFAASAIAGDITGNWKGRIKIDISKISKAPNAAAHSKMMARIPQVQQMVINLSLKADHTFSESAQGGPSRSGTWTLNGNTISLATTVNGKIQGKPDVFTISANGKSFTMSQPDPKSNQKDAIRVTFTR